MRIVLCGVRGSTPAPGAAFNIVGGNTSCVAICPGDDRRPRIVLDAGTGLRAVSALLEGEPFVGTILLGHLHWDHTHGLPFFAAGDHPAAHTSVLLPSQGVAAIDLVSRFMSPPSFAIGPAGLRGEWSFESLEEGEHEIEGFQVLAREIPHKGGRTFGFRISDEGGTIAYLSDHGPYDMFGPGTDGFGPYHEAAVSLCEGTDVLIHDAQYTASELPTLASFGHSAADYAVGLARHCHVPHVVLFHHDPDRTDAQVAAIENAWHDASDVTVEAAREGVTIDLPVPGSASSARGANGTVDR